MKKIKVSFDLGIGYVGAKHKHEEVFEFEDNMTQEEIEEELENYWKEWIWNYIDGGWEIIE
jgi:hypothetical protein